MVKCLLDVVSGVDRCEGRPFKCDNDTRCIFAHWECDQYSDCTDGTDEHSECVIEGACLPRLNQVLISVTLRSQKIMANRIIKW